MSELTYTEREADNNANLGRMRILGVNLGFTLNKLVLRSLQALRLYPKA